MWLIGQDAKTTNQYIKRIGPKADEIIAMSDFLQEEYFRNHGAKPFLVAENGINEEIFPELNIGARRIDVLGVGSLIKLKNYDLFIEIIYELKKKHPEIKAVIAGGGVDEQYYKQIVQEMKLQSQITFCGSIPHDQVLELMNNAKFFLHTSDYEGNSTVLAEALYSGCLTLSTQPLSKKAIKNLTVLKHKEDFVKSIIQLQEDKNYRAERVVFNTMDDTAKKIMNLFLS